MLMHRTVYIMLNLMADVATIPVTAPQLRDTRL